MLREEKKQDALGHVCKLSRKGRYERFVKDVCEIKQKLHVANTEEAVGNALKKLSQRMEWDSKDSQLSEVKGAIADIHGTINAVKLYDFTRSQLDDMLEKLLESAREIISEETKKENAGKLKTLFLQLAEHSDEISEVIDVTKIFG